MRKTFNKNEVFASFAYRQSLKVQLSAMPSSFAYKKGEITPKFKKIVEEFMKEHEDVLKELAKR